MVMGYRQAERHDTFGVIGGARVVPQLQAGFPRAPGKSGTLARIRILLKKASKFRTSAARSFAELLMACCNCSSGEVAWRRLSTPASERFILRAAPRPRLRSKRTKKENEIAQTE